MHAFCSTWLSVFKMNSLWRIPLQQTNKSQQHLVVTINGNCSDLSLRCHEFNICLHIFKDSWIDIVIKLNIYKYIHLCKWLFLPHYVTKMEQRLPIYHTVASSDRWRFKLWWWCNTVVSFTILFKGDFFVTKPLIHIPKDTA